jgi:signal transduction histidine kinase
MTDDSSHVLPGGPESEGEVSASGPSVPSTAAAARDVDECEIEKALNVVVYDSLAPLLVGLSILYLVQMVTHVLLLSRPNAVYISLMAAGSSVVLLLLRVVLTGVDPRSNFVYVLSVLASTIALSNTLWVQALTEEVEVVVMSLLLVGTGFVYLSPRWFFPVLIGSLVAWFGVSGVVHRPTVLFFPAIGLLGSAALGIMMHMVRRRTNRRAERLRRATEQQQEALARTVMVKERQQQKLEESEQSLKEALKDLQETKTELEHREEELSQTVDELTEAKQKAEEASQLKSAMLANMSHEVRTPLTSITGFAEVLTEQAEGRAKQFAGMIHRNSERLLETLSSVLRLSKLEAGKRNLHLEPIDLVAEAKAIRDEQSERANEAGVTLALDLACETCTCILDTGAVQRIFRNLVGNAIKFTEDGGRVTIRVARVTRSDGERLDDAPFSYARLEVEDTGVGMSESFRKNMFQAFQQESPDARSSHEGSGLGLSITRKLVELLKGDIQVESEKGEGTRFIIRLPHHPEEKTEEQVLADVPEGEVGGRESPSGSDGIPSSSTLEDERSVASGEEGAGHVPASEQ